MIMIRLMLMYDRRDGRKAGDGGGMGLEAGGAGQGTIGKRWGR